MTKQASKKEDMPLRYLEVGAGSGALTKSLVRHLNEGDTLDIVELDPQFCKKLKRKYAHLPNINVYEASILDYDQKNYDVVVTSLPLNSFKSSLVDQILLKYKSLVKSGGYISYFEYMGLGNLKKRYLLGKSQADFKTLLLLKNSFVNSYCTEIEKIWWNVPPARVFHCQL